MSKPIRSTQWILAIVAIGLVGCAGPTPSTASGETTVPAEEKIVLAPSFTESELFLIHEGNSLKLGSSYDQAVKVFAPEANSFEFSELPKRFQQPYRGQGWETARESFGTIMYQQRIAVAMYQLDRATKVQLEDLVNLYTSTFSGVTPEKVEGKTVQNWFWKQGGQTLMISATQASTGTLHVAVALGLDDTMKEIGATETALADQVKSVDSRFGREVPK